MIKVLFIRTQEWLWGGGGKLNRFEAEKAPSCKVLKPLT
jgi:hypothetical protein